MRGLTTIFFGRDLAAEDVSTVLVVCSADLMRFPQVLAAVQQRFPKAHLTYIVPREYLRFLPEDCDFRLISELKKSTLRTWREIRSRKYDVTVLMLTGQPVFQKAKLWALFTNYRMLVVYNENLDSFSCGTGNRMALIRHLRWRLREKGVHSATATILSLLLSPLGFIYLLCYTGRGLLRRRSGAKQQKEQRAETN
jgi:hypothetical protein